MKKLLTVLREAVVSHNFHKAVERDFPNHTTRLPTAKELAEIYQYSPEEQVEGMTPYDLRDVILFVLTLVDNSGKLSLDTPDCEHAMRSVGL
jgi:hypothetical protein